jgi:ArsR family transcriptional regulator, arsenate/arsenite/antimonite-responsive transcriptional repressor
MENVVEVLKALSDPSRYAIVNMLLRRDFCVGALAKRLALSEAAVSQHLQVLRNAGVVKGEKRGYYTHYAVDREILTALANEINALSQIVTHCDCGCRARQKGQCCGCGKEGNKNGPLLL